MYRILVILFLFASFYSCKSPEARLPKTQSSGSYIDIDKSVERNKNLNSKEKVAIEQLITTIDGDFIASKNGFWYAYKTKNEDTNSPKPKFGDIINYNYNVKDLKGNIIYTKEELKTQNYAMDKQELFTGLREGLKLLKAGEVVTFIFPSQKAYGYYGDENKIGTNIPIMCEVTVNSIKTETKNN